MKGRLAVLGAAVCFSFLNSERTRRIGNYNEYDEGAGRCGQLLFCKENAKNFKGTSKGRGDPLAFSYAATEIAI